MGGLATGLKAVQSECETVYLSACDGPLLTTEFIIRICSAFTPNDLAAVLFTDKFHPLNAVYRTSILPFVERRLAEGLLRMQELFNEIPHRKLFASDFADIDPDLESVCNINAMDDYTSALNDYNLQHGKHTLSRIASG